MVAQAGQENEAQTAEGSHDFLLFGHAAHKLERPAERSRGSQTRRAARAIESGREEGNFRGRPEGRRENSGVLPDEMPAGVGVVQRAAEGQ